MLSSVKTLERRHHICIRYPHGQGPVGNGPGGGHVNADPRPRKDQKFFTIRHLQDLSVRFFNSLEGVHQGSGRRSFIGGGP